MMASANFAELTGERYATESVEMLACVLSATGDRRSCTAAQLEVGCADVHGTAESERRVDNNNK